MSRVVLKSNQHAVHSNFVMVFVISKCFASSSPVPSLDLVLGVHGCSNPMSSLWCSASSCCESVSFLPVLLPADEATPPDLSKKIIVSWDCAPGWIQPNESGEKQLEKRAKCIFAKPTATQMTDNRRVMKCNTAPRFWIEPAGFLY